MKPKKNHYTIGIYMTDIVAALEIEMMVYRYCSEEQKGLMVETKIMRHEKELSEFLPEFDLLFYETKQLSFDYRERLRYIYQYNDRLVTVFAAQPFGDGFLEDNHNPNIFLWRPMTRYNFGRIFEESENRLREENEEELLCETDQGRVRVPYSDIVVLENYYRNVYVYTQGGQKYRICSTLKTVFGLISHDSRFLRIHQSYVINMQHVVRMTYTKLYMCDGSEWNVSAANRPVVYHALRQFLEE